MLLLLLLLLLLIIIIIVIIIIIIISSSSSSSSSIISIIGQPVADPHLELRRGSGFVLLAQLAFLPPVISSFFTQNKGGGVGRGGDM